MAKKYSLISELISEFGETVPSDSIITTEEIDDLNKKYFEEVFDNDHTVNSMDVINVDSDANAEITSTQGMGSYGILNYFKLPSLFAWYTQPVIQNEVTIHNKENASAKKSKENYFIINEIKKSASDPLSIIIMVIIALFSYIYFAGEFICQMLGLFYPTYYLYTLLHKRSSNKVEKVKSIIKYFIVYGHLEFLSALFSIFGFHFYHLKILVILSILYMAGYRQIWLAGVYNKIIFYDKILIGLVQSATNKFYIEYTSVKSQVSNTKKLK
ncbi:hypothetical protein QJ856_gp1175 [Tupanvirus deep ocean]|uniref:Uncharacterized protein n=2 Tax=Tupanvirus TaxID=2094720 RepID=A0AC62A727_9VIRU|nr:hypothetical protein QJ856_gp1175 [Tupanvirus deep ocean]QKU33586.1 hypothetical protein [Tupanvirus deep ocean]